MNLPKAEHIPDDPDHLPPARRRRARRLLAPLNADERTDFIGDIAHRASPSFDFFLFSLLAGIVLSIGLLLDQPALLLLGSLLAPTMAPVVGLALGAVSGSLRFFLRSLGGLLIGSFLVFLTGLGAGYLAQIGLAATPEQVYEHAQLTWANFMVLALGAIFTCASMMRTGRRSPVASVALAYSLYIPLAAAGYGLVGGIPNLWPDGLVLYTVYLAWAALLGAITLVVFGYRPLTIFGYTFGGALALIGIIMLVGISGTGIVFGGRIALPTLTPTPTPTITPTLTITPSPVPPTETLTPTLTQTLSPTPTETLTPTPTPVFAVIRTEDGKGALMRDEPGGTVVGSFFDGVVVQILPGTIEENGLLWVRVIAPDGTNGWVVQQLLAPITPTP